MSRFEENCVEFDFEENMWSHLAYKLTKVNRKSSPRKSSESQMGLAVELGWEIRVKLLVKLKIIRFTGNMLKHTDRVPGSLTVEVGLGIEPNLPTYIR